MRNYCNHCNLSQNLFKGTGEKLRKLQQLQDLSQGLARNYSNSKSIARPSEKVQGKIDK